MKANDWPLWFQRVMQGAQEDLLDNTWPPPPVYTQLANGLWRVERFNGYGWIVTHHEPWAQALEMGQPAPPTKVPWGVESEHGPA